MEFRFRDYLSDDFIGVSMYSWFRLVERGLKEDNRDLNKERKEIYDLPE